MTITFVEFMNRQILCEILHGRIVRILRVEELNG